MKCKTIHVISVAVAFVSLSLMFIIMAGIRLAHGGDQWLIVASYFIDNFEPIL